MLPEAWHCALECLAAFERKAGLLFTRTYSFRFIALLLYFSRLQQNVSFYNLIMQEQDYIKGKLKGDTLGQFQQKLLEGDFNFSAKLPDFASENSAVEQAEKELLEEDFFFIQRLKWRDRKAQLRLYGILYPKIEKHILNNSGSLDDAKDFTQETIIKLYKKINENSSKIINLIGFALGIVKNDWLKELHKRKRKSEKLQAISKQNITYEIPELEFEDIENCEEVILKESMKALKPEQKAFIEYYDLNEHSIKETAIYFKMDEGSVRVKATRVRNYLHKKITNHHNFDDCFNK